MSDKPYFHEGKVECCVTSHHDVEIVEINTAVFVYLTPTKRSASGRLYWNARGGFARGGFAPLANER